MENNEITTEDTGRMIKVVLHFYTGNKDKDRLPKKHVYNGCKVSVPANKLHGIKSGSKSTEYGVNRNETEFGSGNIGIAIAKAMKNAGVIVVENKDEFLEAHRIIEEQKKKLAQLSGKKPSNRLGQAHEGMLDELPDYL